ncbi:cytidylate kinase [Ruminococcaceae bacterium CPB6]|jgi:cytidylate kinase|uniref:Cytidylate kinase n=1 Tax=Caproicibacterium lactatifermentans TaxID=2666138 RepID=A0A859DQS2_9FIRM|nr:(d)CMP kinase [Caproicibacterium lactatifermentans]ARP50410.1 cytidylate kinase [Ruminococcaceae bacterium CPB6]QKN23869.1 (d)CMP kinase [Caproicibacterium lactatifermentans]
MIQIAIDGPAGAGKSTIARKVAAQLGFLYVDTGALYRAVALHVLRAGAVAADTAAVTALLPSAHISLRYENGLQEVYLQGENVSEEIRTPQVSRAVSAVSAIPEVREFLFGLQQQLARENNVIMDGRDIGTVVLPQAQVKIFLTASPEDRAQRRFQEMQGKGQAVSYETVLADIRKRDEQDTHRAVAPLKQAADAVRVDTTGNTLEESVTRLSRFIRKKLGL